MTVNRSDKKPGKADDPVVIETKPGHHKEIGGGESDKWNFRQMRLLLSALPGVNSGDKKKAGESRLGRRVRHYGSEATDPIEGMLASQIAVAHEAALDMYRRAWSQPPEYFEARCRYLSMADRHSERSLF